MLFSATYGCAGCLVRFARRETCPSCGRATAKPLRSRPITPAAAAPASAKSGAAAGVGILLALPAVLLERTLSTLALGTAGIVLVVIAFAMRRRPEPRALPAPRVRVALPRSRAPADVVRLEGVARLASVAIPAPVSGATCLLFGLRASLPGHELEDADGGDFDLELDGGERVTVSLEHAVLEDTDATARHHVVTPDRAGSDGELQAFLAARGISLPASDVEIDETLVRDGDRVAVTGGLLGGKLVAVTKGASRRVVAGDAEHPLVVAKLRGTTGEARPDAP